MRKLTTHILLLVVAVVAVAQGSASAQQTLTRAQYIEKYAPMAVESQLLYGIPASITLYHFVGMCVKIVL